MPLTPGTRIGNYEIAEPLGAGGMGEVYRGRDTRLARDVAIKLLPASLIQNARAIERFRREARLVGSVNHPHICTLFDAGDHDGRPYLVMELLEGGTLQGRVGTRVPSEHVIEWALQIADALEAAHGHGIIHRDLKPSNIAITARGAKILDFGIAKLADSDSPADATTMAALTSVGTMLGTAAYMAPEQVKGEPLDGRADLFSLGVLLYEISAGRHPFGGNSATVVAAILARDPAPLRTVNPAIPDAFSRIVHKLLEKDPGLRYQHASDLRTDLRRAKREAGGVASVLLEAPPVREVAPQVKSVAVLPFRNMSGDADSVFLSDGIAEDLIDALSRVPGVRVSSRASAFRFRDPDTSSQQIGRELKVDAVVQGSVRRAGSKLRVSAQLIDAASGFQSWSEKYDREFADVFDIQDEIVGALASALTPALTGGGATTVRRPTDNLEAYEWYLKGRHYWHQRSPTTLKLAIKAFEQAIALDPNYALAYAGLADSWALYRPYGWLPMIACRPPAKHAIDRAIALAPELPEVQFSKALHDFYFERHWRKSEPFFKRAIELNPRSSLARVYYAVFLGTDYRAAEAAQHAAAATELDPLSPFIHGIAGLSALAAGDVAAAERGGRRALELQSDYLLAFWLLAITLDNAGRVDEAEAMIQRATSMSRAPIFISMLAKIHARQGRGAECAAIESELEDRRSRGEYVSRACDVVIATGKQDVAALRAALAACIAEETSWFTVRLGPGPGLESLRSDPEVARLLDELYDGARPGRPRAT